VGNEIGLSAIDEMERAERPERSNAMSSAGRELQQSEELYRNLVASILDSAIVLLDFSGNVTTWNEGAERIQGYSAAEILGRNFSAFYTPEALERETPRFELSRARENGRFAGEGWRLRPDGSPYWASIVITAIPVGDGSPRGFIHITRDLTGQRTQLMALRESEERFRLLVEGVQEYAIFMLDPEGKVTSWNRGAEMIKGYAASEIIGSHFSRFYPQEAILQGKPAWELETATRYGSVEEEGWRVRKDGSRFWANVVITALRDKEGDLRGFAKVTRDMTERRRVEQLEQADRQKDEFLALLAHELRNPLAPIRTALEVLRRRDVSAPALDQAGLLAERQLRNMARLLDDLLDVSRIREGRIELRKEPLNVSTLLRAAADAARPLMDERRHDFVVDDPANDIWVEGDGVRLEQVLGNLLNNAAKYTEPGGEIRLSANSNDGNVFIRVQDTGIGIEPLMVSRVFDLFVQAERRTELSAGGVGVGLSLARKLVELHGGRVEAFSAGAGRGAEFIVRLPTTAPPPAAEEKLVASAVAATAHGLRVLLVDDNVDSADGLGLLLELQGHEIRVAYDGPTALETARQFRPHVALLDIGMPSMDGYELGRRLHATPETKDVLLVAMTGWGQDEDHRKSREAGFAHHLVKPFEPAVLEKVLAGVKP
jgi:PAS domain S-box-containing protein